MVGRVVRVGVRRRRARRNSAVFMLAGAGIALLAYTVGRGGAPEPRVERQRAYVAEFNTVDIPVPERPIPAGMPVREMPVRIEKFPEHQLPSGTVRDLSRFRDGVTLVSLPGGLPIIDSNLGSSDELSNPVVGKIPPGMRAMTVRVDATASVEGWARTGSLVDVLLVQKDRTTVVAEKVRVLSTERSTSLVEEQGAGTIPTTATLLVTQEQCLAINTAVPLGRIAFALRSNRDSERWRNTRFSADQFSTKDQENSNHRVGGAVTIKNGASKRHFALVEGSWIPTDDVPAGFLREKGDDSVEEDG